ncbi:6-bladed beta-propeller [Belliella baltica]|uniref:6-bladed beta-propeller n=1 Tax=Belliella baltica TaxID=232259 RepID=UPI0012FAEF50|nr:6-bladed beta-propeller [Belliella baltica]
MSTIIVIVFLFSCSTKNTEVNQDGIKRISMGTEFSNTIDYFSDTSFIPLEFCEDCIVGDIHKILKVKDGFVISDKNISNQVFKFSDNGVFQFKIGDKGDGLGNYLLPFDISLIPSTDQIAILDQNQRKIIFYSLEDGSFLRELPINFQAKSIQFLSPNTVAVHFDGKFSGNEKDYLGGILDLKKGEFIYLGVNDFSKTDQNKTAGDFYFSGHELIFSKSLNDTIYSVFEKKITPKYFIDFGEKKVSDEIKILPLMDMRMRMMQELPHYHNGNFIENDNFLFFLWWGKDEFENLAFYNKANDKLDLIKGRDQIIKRPFFMDNQYLYSFLTNSDYESLNTEPFFGLSQNQVILKVELK